MPQVLAQVYQRFTFTVDPEATKIGDDGLLPQLESGIHLQLKHGMHLCVHERPMAK